jgi:fibro-slime domain-containing protein
MKTSGLMRTVSFRWMTAALGVCLLSAEAFGQDPPAQVDLPVVLRDFSRDHPDFNVIPVDGYGYYHGNVDLDLDEDGKPVYTGGGFKDQSLWKDAAKNPIAPHLYNTCGFLTPLGGGGESGAASVGLVVDRTLLVKYRSVIDGFDSNQGPYAEGNADLPVLVRVNGTSDHPSQGKRPRWPWWRRGPKHDPVVEVKRNSTIKGDVMVAPELDPQDAVKLGWKGTITGTVGQLDAAVEMPVSIAPELGDDAGRVRFRGGEHAISSDLSCRELTLYRGALVTIEGDVTILVDGDVKLDNRSEIRLQPDSSLDLYVAGSLKVLRGSRVNMDPGDPQRMSVTMLGDDECPDHGRRRWGRWDQGNREHRLTLDRRSRMAAWVQGAEAALSLDDRSEFFGAFIGRSAAIEGRSSLHVDMASGSGGGGFIVYEPEECELGDLAGVVALASGGDVLSAGTFAEWWRDVLGVNMSTVQSLTLTRDPLGTYAFINDNYRPLDGQLLGNEGDVHNYHFTLEFDADFTYDATAGQWLEVRCTDDTYVFINGRLVIDLGGLGFNKVQYVDLDRLGLPDGEPARLQLFHAQRQRGLAIFRVRTNLVLASDGASPTVNAVLDD